MEYLKLLEENARKKLLNLCPGNNFLDMILKHKQQKQK